jgi:hypothetical protein
MNFFHPQRWCLLQNWHLPAFPNNNKKKLRTCHDNLASRPTNSSSKFLLNLEPGYFLSLPFSWSLMDKANSTRLLEPLGKSFVFFIFKNQIIPAPTSSHKSNHSCAVELFAGGVLLPLPGEDGVGGQYEAPRLGRQREGMLHPLSGSGGGVG